MSARVAVAIGVAGTLTTFTGLPIHAKGALDGAQPAAGYEASAAPGQRGKPGKSGIATYSELPTLGTNAEARAVNRAGTTIAGFASDRQGLLHAVKWTLVNGVWTIADLPIREGAVSAEAAGVNDSGDVAGRDYSSTIVRTLIWPVTGGLLTLGCGPEPAQPLLSVRAISAAAQIVAGAVAGRAALWRPGACREDLPVLVEGQSAYASAINGDGTIVGGGARITPTAPGESLSVPVRWRSVGGQWTIEQLDGIGGVVRGGNASGDLAGSVEIPCGSETGCDRAVIWFAAGGSFQLGTLGGDHSWAHDVNDSGEVVGVSTSPTVGNTAFFWSEAAGMVQLPFKGRFAVAFAVSDVRPDGTRLAVGVASGGGAKPAAWVIRNR